MTNGTEKGIITAPGSGNMTPALEGG